MTLNKVNRINIAYGNSKIEESVEKKSVEIHIEAIFQNKAQVFVINKEKKIPVRLEKIYLFFLKKNSNFGRSMLQKTIMIFLNWLRI